MISDKKGFEFSFAWIFALTFGAIIIFLSVYMAFNIVSSQRNAADAGLSKGFDTLLYPVGTGLESNKVTLISFPVETKVTLSCNANGNFGEQIIQTSASSSLGKKYSQNPIHVRSYDKFIFAQSPIEGKNFLTFVKPVDMPFRIADFVIFIPIEEKYCFVLSKSNNVGKEIENFKKENHNFNRSFFTGDLKDCPKDSRKICFNMGKNEECYANVDGNKVTKGAREVYIDGGETSNALLYAAIFSEADYYECQIRRLNKRASELSMLYIEKQKVGLGGCGEGLESPLIRYVNITMRYKNTTSLGNVLLLSKELGGENDRLSCPLF